MFYLNTEAKVVYEKMIGVENNLEVFSEFEVADSVSEFIPPYFLGMTKKSNFQ